MIAAFRICNICPENAFIKFPKTDKKVKLVQDSNLRSTDCYSTIQPTEISGKVPITEQIKPINKK